MTDSKNSQGRGTRLFRAPGRFRERCNRAFSRTGSECGRHKIMSNKTRAFRMRELAYDVGASSEEEVVVMLEEVYR